jgi:hypothetical protein
MSDPWMKWYPADWRSDPRLRMCSLAARGLWQEMLCVMHEATPRGFLLVNGNAPTDRQLAGLAGCSAREVVKLLAELEAAGVFSRDEVGVVFSRRMVKDEERASRDRANGRQGGSPILKGGVNPPDKPEDKAQKPEARGKSPELINHQLISVAARTDRPKPFPSDGPIDYAEPFAGIARRQGRGLDLSVLASNFRKFCHAAQIAFDDPLIARKFETFCGKHKLGRLAA